MPIGGTRETNKRLGEAYRKSPLHDYAKAFSEVASAVLQESGFDIFEEPCKVLRRKEGNAAMRKFFVEGFYDENDTTKDERDIEDILEQADAQFDNDVDAMLNESSAMAEYNPIVGMALPIHKLILMNNVYDKGGIQKFTAVQPKFTISLERRILIKPDGTEIDMFLQQNQIADAIDSTNPTKEIELSLPVDESKDIVGDEFGGTVRDHLDISTYICAVKVKDVFIEAGDILPNEDGYIEKDGEVATEDTTADVWFHTDIRFTPAYGGPNHFDRTVTQPLQITKKVSATEVETIKAVITGSMNKDRFNIADLNGQIEDIRLSAKLDSSNAMLETVRTAWRVDTDLVEIPTATPINITFSPEEVKDLAAMYNVNQLTKQMELIKTTLGEYKDMTIKRKLDEVYNRLDERTSFAEEFDFAPRADYALSHVEWRHATFMDFLDDLVTRMLQVLNDPNMTVTIFGDPRIVRKITPKEYSYVAPANIGPVTLDYTQTIVNMSDKRTYNFIGSDKLRNTNELMILLNPKNSERICIRIYDYQLYVSNEIRNIANPALPAIHAFERYIVKDYQPVMAKTKILNPSGLIKE